MERRTFIKGALAGVGALKGALAAAGEGSPPISAAARPPGPPASTRDLIVPPDGYEPPSWLRFSRTLYFDGYSPPLYPRLDDYDAERLVRIAQDLGCDTLRFQPVGRWAYYPTKSRYPIHPELGSRDLIAETVRACRKAGLHLYCYTMYQGDVLSVDFLRRHPEYLDWIARGPDGKPSVSAGDTNDLNAIPTPKADATGDALRETLHQVVREYCSYDIDGAYFDAPGAIAYTDFCYCDTCRRKFKAYCGMDIDRVQNPDDMEARITWYRWFGDMELADLFEFRKLLHGSGKFMLCHNGASWRPQAMRQQYRIPEGFMVESQVQVHRRLMAGMMGAAMARPTKKLYQMYMGGFGLADPYQPPHNRVLIENTSMEDEEDILMEGFANLACGAAPIYGTGNRLFYGLGSGSAGPAREVFGFMRQVEPILKDSLPVPYVTLVPTWESLQLWRTKRTGWNVPMSEGFALAMLDGRLSLDVCPSTEITEDWLRDRRVIALCGASGLTDELTRLLANWVEQGGGLLATYDTGLYDENGRIRPGGALREVLGVEIQGEPLDSQADCFYRIQQTHPALGDYHAGTAVKGDGKQPPVKAVGSAQVLADCWNLGTKESRGPAIVVNTFGRGRTVYIAGSLEAHYTASRVASHRRVLAAAVRYLAGNAPVPFTLRASRGVYGVMRQAPNGDPMLWILANVGFKDADIGRMRQEYTPVADVEVGMLLPEGRAVKSVRLLRAGRSVSFTVSGGYVRTSLPSVHVAEVVQVELG